MDCYRLFYNKVKPFLAVTLLQFGFAGLEILSRTALTEGTSSYVLVAYRHAVAAVLTAPFAIILEKKMRPKMTLKTFVQIVMLSILEPVITQNLYLLRMKYTTTIFAAAMGNIFPAIMFIVACIFRLEQLRFKSIRSQAKVFGTIVTVVGVIVMTLVKGPVLEMISIKGIALGAGGGATGDDPIKGAIMIVAGSFSLSAFIILKAVTLKTYPAELSLSAWICLLGTIEGAAVALVTESGIAVVWAINWDTKLLSIVYGGIMCSGLVYYIQGVVTSEKGPVFVAAFSPLCMVFVAILGSVILAEQMFLGRLLGAIVVVAGLYLVVWGKAKDQPTESPLISEHLPISDRHDSPLVTDISDATSAANLEIDSGVIEDRTFLVSAYSRILFFGFHLAAAVALVFWYSIVP